MAEPLTLSLSLLPVAPACCCCHKWSRFILCYPLNPALRASPATLAALTPLKSSYEPSPSHPPLAVVPPPGDLFCAPPKRASNPMLLLLLCPSHSLTHSHRDTGRQWNKGDGRKGSMGSDRRRRHRHRARTCCCRCPPPWGLCVCELLVATSA